MLGFYRKPTKTDTTTLFVSDCYMEHKLTAYIFYINRMTTLPITERCKQQEWNIILSKAKFSVFPLYIIHNLKDKLLYKTHKTKNSSTQTKKKWIIFTNHSPLVHKVTNLFKHTGLNIAFKAANILHSHLNSKSPHDERKLVAYINWMQNM